MGVDHCLAEPIFTLFSRVQGIIYKLTTAVSPAVHHPKAVVRKIEN